MSTKAQQHRVETCLMRVSDGGAFVIDLADAVGQVAAKRLAANPAARLIAGATP